VGKRFGTFIGTINVHLMRVIVDTTLGFCRRQNAAPTVRPQFKPGGIAPGLEVVNC
jgi:hypothetical protein